MVRNGEGLSGNRERNILWILFVVGLLLVAFSPPAYLYGESEYSCVDHLPCQPYPDFLGITYPFRDASYFMLAIGLSILLLTLWRGAPFRLTLRKSQPNTPHKLTEPPRAVSSSSKHILETSSHGGITDEQ